jgi:hypothetical protein
MNLIQITEQLKNPAITVPQLMQYANNSNPQVPSYVALAEMQRRQSMQAPAQAPQETVKDQLGAQLMGLPSVAPQQSPQQPQQQPPQQPQGQQPQGIQTAPMPDSKSALPTQPGMTPGMAGGGLTSIPLDMHHDYASGGIIAFADGGYPAGYEIPEKMTEEQARAEREKAKQIYGFGGDPYAEAKRRYAEIEAKQKEAEKGAGFDRVISSLAAMGAGGPRQFGDVMASYANTSTNIEKERRKESEQNAMKMAELHSLWGKEQDALKRSEYEAVMGRVDKARAAQAEALTARRQFDQVQASTTQAEAAAKNAETLEAQRKFEQEQHPSKFKLEERKVAAEELRARSDAANASRKGAEESIINNIWSSLKATNPKATYMDAFNAFQSGRVAGKAALTQDQMIDAWQKMPIQDKMARKARAGGDVLKAEQDYYRELKGLPSVPTGGTNPYSTKSDAEIKAALGIK